MKRPPLPVDSKPAPRTKPRKKATARARRTGMLRAAGLRAPTAIFDAELFGWLVKYAVTLNSESVGTVARQLLITMYWGRSRNLAHAATMLAQALIEDARSGVFRSYQRERENGDIARRNALHAATMASRVLKAAVDFNDRQAGTERMQKGHAR